MPTNGKGPGAIVNIDQLLAPDITFLLGEDRWTISGNISARTALTIQRLYTEFEKAADSGDMDDTISAYSQVHDFLVPLFKYKRPDLEELPWDFNTTLRVMAVILARALGAEPHSLAEAASDPPRTTSTPRTRSRSTRPTGSARS